MINLKIPYNQLELISYQGSGNITPVLDLSVTKGICNFNPEEVRAFLENNYQFRVWLKEHGQRLNADSVMAFYIPKNSSFELVTFVCEPNNSLTAPFSEMCGNGIRALALHFYLSSNRTIRQQILKNGLRIWAGGLRTVRIENINLASKKGLFRVDLGKFQTSLKFLGKYIKPDKLASINKTQPLNNLFGLGLNGQEDGEPHIVCFVNQASFLSLSKRLISNQLSVIDSLRELVCLFGPNITFNSIFPRGINFSLAVCVDSKLYLSTHERNLSRGFAECFSQSRVGKYCKCNTLACGTAGAVASNLAKINGLISTNFITTIHPGGEIKYLIGDSTQMIGEAAYIDPKLTMASSRNTIFLNF